MSVNECGRGNCKNVMCDLLIMDASRYICPECFSELLEYRTTWPETMTKLQVSERMHDFMKTDCGMYLPLDRDGIEEEFKRLTGSE